MFEPISGHVLFAVCFHVRASPTEHGVGVKDPAGVYAPRMSSMHSISFELGHRRQFDSLKILRFLFPVRFPWTCVMKALAGCQAGGKLRDQQWLQAMPLAGWRPF